MIVVKIELWPGGDAARSREIGRTYINNVTGKDDLGGKRGDYDVRVMRKDCIQTRPRDMFLNGKGILRTGHVSNYPRLTYNVWRLVIRALKSAFPEE
jgi:hypothetical protein